MSHDGELQRVVIALGAGDAATSGVGAIEYHAISVDKVAEALDSCAGALHEIARALQTIAEKMP